MRHFLRCLLAAVFGLGAAGSAMGYATSRVISVNIRGGSSSDDATDSAGIVAVPAKAWNNYQTVNTDYSGGVTWDGSETVTLSKNWTVRPSGNTVWYWVPDGIESILRCYVDDNADNHAKMIFSNLPFSCYDVYVYMAADSSAQFSPVSTIIDGVTTPYTCGDDGMAYRGASSWGQSQTLTSKLGTNVMCIAGLSAKSFTIDGGTRGTTRGAIAAVQIVESSSAAYTATVSRASAKFSDLTWEPALPAALTGTEALTVKVEDVNATELEFDEDVSASRLAVTGAADVSLVQSNGVDLAISLYDFSAATGKLTLGIPVVKGASWYAKNPNVVFDYAHTGVPPVERGTLEYSDAALAWSNQIEGDWTLKVSDGDKVSIDTTSNMRPTFNMDVSGGTVTFDPNGSLATAWYGKNGATTYNQTGGEVRFNVNGQGQSGSGYGVILGYTSASSATFVLNISGGLFAIENSSINFWNKATISLTTGGTVRAKGVFASSSTPDAHRIDVDADATFELGSLGMTADACTFTLGGGTLRGYEAGATMANPITLSGSSTLSSAPDASLTASGGASGTGKITISEGTVKLGKDSGLGSVPVTVADGATFDLNGFKPGNALTISGTGVDGVGALVNNGAGVTCQMSLALSSDATVGGTGPITNQQALAINLNGHVLTIDGDKGFAYVLGHGTVLSGGGIKVSSGALATYGQSVALEGDLAIVGGTLDLSSGTSLSCRNFSFSRGEIKGIGAELIVSGVFDASKTVSVAKLQLGDSATLNGVGLTVTSRMTLGEKLSVTLPEEKLAKIVKLAAVPAGTTVPEKMELTVNGGKDYKLVVAGMSLLAVKSDVLPGRDVFADAVVSNAAVLTNFAELRIDGTIGDFYGTAIGETNINVVISYEDGTVTTQRFDYVVGEDGSFTNYIAGLEQGKSYDVSVFVSIEGAEIFGGSGATRVTTAKTIDGWIDEDADTFSEERTGTGYWNDLHDVASVVNRSIRIASDSFDEVVLFEPKSRTGARKEVCIRIVFDNPSASLGDEPKNLDRRDVGITVADGLFMVVTNGVWAAVPRSMFAPEAGEEYEIVIRTDERAGIVTYGVVGADSTVTTLASGSYATFGNEMRLAFAGAVSIAKIDGTCYDANLMSVDGNEYWDFDKAREAAGATHAIVPLWWTRYEFKDESGSFCVVNNDGYLELVFAKWYHWLVERDEDELYYRYRASNNWIDYADETGVEPVNGGWLVANEGGLAWLAESATNKWLAGSVTLGADLDLASKNWTPIASFTGAFDGNGHTVTGLNNTNAVDDPLLGEAGYYYGGPANDWGYTAYGLFGCATNASFRDVTFANVAISNMADSAAALLGVHAGGDLSVVNVTNASGFVRGEGRAVAGLLTVGGKGDAIGNVVVTGNVNRAVVACSLANVDDGGNVAQILAGTTWGTVLGGDVVATNNVGGGACDVRVTDGAVTKDWEASGFSWLDLPVCNFAPAVIRTDTKTNFWSFVEANNPQSVVIDPFLRTARMSAGFFANGEKNVAGWWIDTISALPEGSTVTLEGTGNTIDIWNTVAVDRNLTFDLNANVVYSVYDCDVFAVTDGKMLTLKNGVIYYAEGFSPMVGSVVFDGIKTAELVGDFYERTVPLSGLDVKEGCVTIEVPHSSEYFYYVVDSTPTLAGDWTPQCYKIGDGSPLSISVPAAGESGFYRVRITDEEPTDATPAEG